MWCISSYRALSSFYPFVWNVYSRNKSCPPIEFPSMLPSLFCFYCHPPPTSIPMCSYANLCSFIFFSVIPLFLVYWMNNMKAFVVSIPCYYFVCIVHMIVLVVSIVFMFIILVLILSFSPFISRVPVELISKTNSKRKW